MTSAAEIKLHTTWAHTMKILSDDTGFVSALTERDRLAFFEEVLKANADLANCSEPNHLDR